MLTDSAVPSSRRCKVTAKLKFFILMESIRVPPNCRFLVDDCNSPWVFEQKFDLIHTRAMTPGIKDWPRYLQQAYECAPIFARFLTKSDLFHSNLRPGGYIELQELHCPIAYAKDDISRKPYFVEYVY